MSTKNQLQGGRDWRGRSQLPLSTHSSSFSGANAPEHRLQQKPSFSSSSSSSSLQPATTFGEQGRSPESPDTGSSNPSPSRLERFLRGVSNRIAGKQDESAGEPSKANSNITPKEPLIGIIDTEFSANSHGAEIQKTISNLNPEAPLWLGRGVSEGRWADSLKEFVQVAEASGQWAIANLSFDLTQVNRDGSVSTRYQLTADEQAALASAQKAGIPVFASIGNEASSRTAWEQADKQFDNLIVIGGSEGRDRAATSSYGSHLDLLAPNRLPNSSSEGTSQATAYATGVASKVWAANPQLNAQQLEQVLKSSATDLNTPGRDNETGFGSIDPTTAIERAKQLTGRPVEIIPNERENAIWQGTNGAIASERPNRLLKYESGMPLRYDERVKQWQQRMQERGWNITVDGLYGSQSAHIARQFQKEKGLAVDGIVGPDTWAATFDTTNVTGSPKVVNSLSSGASLNHLLKYKPGVPLQYDERVKQWQQRMQERGWNITVDGFYGSQSAHIARQFQKEKGLAVDGIVGPDTWAATFDTTNVTGSVSAPPLNPSGRPGIPSNSARKLLDIARSYLGVQEQGNNSGAQVQEFQRAVDGVARREPWCMSFAQYCIKATERATQTNSQVAQSEHCLTVWNQSPSELKRSSPDPGSLVIWRHGNSTRGHVGIVEAVHADGTFTTIEGNTSDSSGINREGEGVYRKQRNMDGAGNMRVVGFLKVFPDDTSHVSKPSPKELVAPLKRIASKPSPKKLVAPLKRIAADAGKPSPFSGDIDPRPGFGDLSIWRYDTNGRSTQDIKPGKETVVVIHGWNSDDQSAGIQNLAKKASKSDVQVLALDWSSIAKAGLDDLPKIPDILPPYNTAKWIAPVARWTHNNLVKLGIDPKQLTLVGHSLGSYVSAEISKEFGQVKNLVALDPAFPATNSLIEGYDIDGSKPGQQSPANFRDVATNSLAFVAKNRTLGIPGGASGDSDKAATAHNSFVVQFPELQHDAHSRVVDVFRNALAQGHLKLPDLSLPNHEDNWYSDNGNKNSLISKLPDLIGDPIAGKLDLNHHEGRISATSTGDIEELIRVVDSSGTEELAWT